MSQVNSYNHVGGPPLRTKLVSALGNTALAVEGVVKLGCQE